MHSDAYGSLNFRAAEYLEIINEVQIFVQDFRKFDKKIIRNEFNDTFISVRHPEVEVRKEARILKLGGFSFKCEYSVFV
ncbi:unnamed protein product [Auanema sp. JU1783]|nr:unnamed protein product [Auanema sp. JU1783]